MTAANEHRAGLAQLIQEITETFVEFRQIGRPEHFGQRAERAIPRLAIVHGSPQFSVRLAARSECIRIQTSRPSLSPRLSIKSARRAASTASAPYRWIRRLAARQMSISGISRYGYHIGRMEPVARDPRNRHLARRQMSISGISRYGYHIGRMELSQYGTR